MAYRTCLLFHGGVAALPAPCRETESGAYDRLQMFHHCNHSTGTLTAAEFTFVRPAFNLMTEKAM